MACRDTLPSDPSFLLEYLEQLLYESDCDGDEFEAYLGRDDGPVIIRAIDSASYKDQERQSPPPSLPFAGQPNRNGPGVRVSFAKH